MYTALANNLDLDQWNKVKNFANKHNRKILLVGEDFHPNEDRWESIYFEIHPNRDGWGLFCDIVNQLHPNEIHPVCYDGKQWLRLWWD